MIAHPDDEAMFFAPSIIQLNNFNKISVLCLSNGNFAGLGKTREKELEKSCEVFDIEPPVTIDVHQLQDGAQWKTEDIIE